MKITKENGTGDCSEYTGCWVRMKCASSLGTKVVEVPKFWRENGKQYRVISFTPKINRDNKNKIIIRASWICTIVGVWPDLDNDYKNYYTVKIYD